MGMGTGNGRSSDSKNMTIFWGEVYVVDKGGGGNSALMDFTGTESQGERFLGSVVDKVRLNICGEAFKKSSMEKKNKPPVQLVTERASWTSVLKATYLLRKVGW